MNLSCKCGKFGTMEINRESELPRFQSVAIVCRFCNRATWWHSGRTLQESCIFAMDDWEVVQDVRTETASG